MTTILQIDSSILGENSVSRDLTAEAVAKLQNAHPDARLIKRDLVADETLHLSLTHMAVRQGGDAGGVEFAADMTLSSAYISELFDADILVIGAPMYNFSVPSQLKAWIDRVCVVGKTFRYDADGPKGLLQNKRVFIVSTRGGFYSGSSAAAGMDHQESYLKVVFGFMGLTDVTIIRAEGLSRGDAAKATAIAQARADITNIAA